MKEKHCEKCSFESQEKLFISNCAFCGCHNKKKTKKNIVLPTAGKRKEIKEYQNFIKKVEKLLKKYEKN